MAVFPDNLPNDLKVIALSPSALRLWVLARCLCSLNLTDGLIPKAALAMPLAAKRRDVRELCEAGLWDELQSGAVVDNTYLVDNPTAADAQADRDRAAKRIDARREADRTRQQKRRHRKRQSNTRHAECHGPESVTGTVTERDSHGPVSVTDGVTGAVTPEIPPPHTPPPDPVYSSGVGISSVFPEASSSYQPSSETDQVARASENRASRLREQAREVFDFWVADTGKKRALFDGKRESRIKARLREGFTVEELKAAIRNRKNDPFLMGKSRGSDGKVYDEIDTLLRGAAQVERLRDLVAPLNGSAPQSRADAQLERQLERVRMLEEQERQAQ